MTEYHILGRGTDWLADSVRPMDILIYFGIELHILNASRNPVERSAPHSEL